MNIRMVIGCFVATLMVFQGMAQRAENDDMYFNSKDRKKQSVTSSISANDKIDSDYKAFKKKHFDKNEEVRETEAAENKNPTDSYSARSVNPEFVSRSNSEEASEEQNYFIEGYTDSVNAGDYNNYSNNNYNNNTNWNYNNGWYGPSAWNSYSPYYGYCDPWMSPYYYGRSGWSVSLMYSWGNAWSPGWNYGMGYGWSNSYYNPYSYGYSPYYSNYGGDYSRVNYGKRPSRHSAMVTPVQRTSQRISSTTNGSTNRTRQTTDDYYVKPSKRTSSFGNLLEEIKRGDNTRPSSTDTRTRTRDSYNNSRDSRPTYSTPSRGSSGGSAPSRSSGGSSGSRSRRN
jgi:hypothetical protein